MDIAATFFNNLIPYVRDFLISEGVKVPQILSTETNHKGNHMILLARNAAVESENDIITINAAAQPVGGSLRHRTFMSMPAGSPSIKISGLSSSFEYE